MGASRTLGSTASMLPPRRAHLAAGQREPRDFINCHRLAPAAFHPRGAPRRTTASGRGRRLAGRGQAQPAVPRALVPSHGGGGNGGTAASVDPIAFRWLSAAQKLARLVGDAFRGVAAAHSRLTAEPERSIGKLDLAVLDSQGGGCGLHRFQRLSGNQMAAFSEGHGRTEGSWRRVPRTLFWTARSDSSHRHKPCTDISFRCLP